jgi:exonuclease III
MPRIHNHNHLKILQWNCGAINTSLSDLISAIEQSKPHVILIQETWLKEGSTLINEQIKQYSIFRADRCGRGGGVLIATRDDISSRITKEYSHMDRGAETLIVKFEYKIRSLFFVNIYICLEDFLLVKIIVLSQKDISQRKHT